MPQMLARRTKILDDLATHSAERVQDALRRSCSTFWEGHEHRRATDSEARVMADIVQQFLTILRGWISQDIDAELQDEPFLLPDLRHAELAEWTGEMEKGDELREEAMARWAAFRMTGNEDDLWRPWQVEGFPHLSRWLFPRALRYTKERLEEARRAGCPALSMMLLDRIRVGILDRRRTLRQETQFEFLDRHGQRSGFIAPPSWSQGRDFPMKATETLAAHRLLFWLVVKANDQVVARETRDYRTVSVSGGLSGLARLLGLRGWKAEDDLREALDVLQELELMLPWGSAGSILAWTLQSEAPGRPAEVRIIPGKILLPGFVFQVPKSGNTYREWRMLVPVPETFPPLSVHPFHQAAAVRLVMLILSEFRFHAEVLANEKWVRISDERWNEIAREAHFPSHLLGELLGEWSRDPANRLLERSSEHPDRWRLGTAYAREKMFIEAAGVQQGRGRLRQQRSRQPRERGRRSRRRSSNRSAEQSVEGR